MAADFDYDVGGTDFTQKAGQQGVFGDSASQGGGEQFARSDMARTGWISSWFAFGWVFVFGICVGILMADAGSACETRWWHYYRDVAWAWKISRWDNNWMFRTVDGLWGTIWQQAALWATGLVTGPLSASLLAAVGYQFLWTGTGSQPSSTPVTPSYYPQYASYQNYYPYGYGYHYGYTQQWPRSGAGEWQAPRQRQLANTAAGCGAARGGPGLGDAGQSRGRHLPADNRLPPLGARFDGGGQLGTASLHAAQGGRGDRRTDLLRLRQQLLLLSELGQPRKKRSRRRVL